MEAERFCEILMEEGLPLSFIKAVWADRANSVDEYQSERALRLTARELKDTGLVQKWRALEDK